MREAPAETASRATSLSLPPTSLLPFADIQEFTNPPTLTQNVWSWNNISNNLFIEAPAGVGFSYCDKAAGCRHTDTSTADDNLQTLISFFKAFPEYAGNDVWISGESYVRSGCWSVGEGGAFARTGCPPARPLP